MKALCLECDTIDHVDAAWRCLWCETRTLRSRPRRTRRTQPRSLTVKRARAAHAMHAQGATIREAAEATFTGAGYSSIHSYVVSLRNAWDILRLPTRSARDTQRLAWKQNPDRPTPVPPRKRVSDEAMLAAILASPTLAAAARMVGVHTNAVSERAAKLRRLGLLA